MGGGGGGGQERATRTHIYIYMYMGVSKNRGTPKSTILIRFSIINHPFWGTNIFGNIHIYIYIIQTTYNISSIISL